MKATSPDILRRPSAARDPHRLPTAPPRAALPAPPVPRRASLPRALKPTTPRVAGTRGPRPSPLENPPLLTRRRPHRPTLPGNPAPFLPQADPGPSIPPHQTPPLPPTLTLPTPTRTLNLPSPFFLLRPFFLHDLSSFLRFSRHELTRPGMDSPEPRHLRMTRITPAERIEKPARRVRRSSSSHARIARPMPLRRRLAQGRAALQRRGRSSSTRSSTRSRSHRRQCRGRTQAAEAGESRRLLAAHAARGPAASRRLHDESSSRRRVDPPVCHEGRWVVLRRDRRDGGRLDDGQHGGVFGRRISADRGVWRGVAAHVGIAPLRLRRRGRRRGRGRDRRGRADRPAVAARSTPAAPRAVASTRTTGSRRPTTRRRCRRRCLRRPRRTSRRRRERRTRLPAARLRLRRRRRGARRRSRRRGALNAEQRGAEKLSKDAELSRRRASARLAQHELQVVFREPDDDGGGLHARRHRRDPARPNGISGAS